MGARKKDSETIYTIKGAPEIQQQQDKFCLVCNKKKDKKSILCFLCEKKHQAKIAFIVSCGGVAKIENYIEKAKDIEKKTEEEESGQLLLF